MKKRLNVLFICGWYPSRFIEGGGIFIQRHSEAVNIKHNVFAIHIISDKNNKKSIEIDSQIRNGVQTHIGYLKPTKNAFLKFYRYYTAYKKILKKLPNIDITHLNVIFPLGIVALIQKNIKKTPFIISEHWTGYQHPLCKSIGLFQKIMTRYIVSKATIICPVSKNLEKAMCEFKLRGNYYPVSNTVNTNLFKPIYVKKNNFEITHISNMVEESKNVTSILKVISKLEKQIPNLKFNLIGFDSKKYLKKIKDLNIKNTQVVNYVPHKKMVHYLQQSNLFVLFSNRENLPCVILESFACGVPVVSSDVGGIKEYFPKDFGLLVPQKDESALEKAILKMYHNQEKIDKQKMHNYAVKHFGKEAICNTFTKIYNKTMRSK